MVRNEETLYKRCHIPISLNWGRKISKLRKIVWATRFPEILLMRTDPPSALLIANRS
jgi:hypothetical protein